MFKMNLNLSQFIENMNLFLIFQSIIYEQSYLFNIITVILVYINIKLLQQQLSYYIYVNTFSILNILINIMNNKI